MEQDFSSLVTGTGSLCRNDRNKFIFDAFLLRYPHSVEDIFYDHVRRDALADRFIGESDTVTEDLVSKRLDILWHDEVTTFEKCPDTSTSDERESCASRGSVFDILRRGFRWFSRVFYPSDLLLSFLHACCFEDARGIVIDFLVDFYIFFDIFLDF